MSLVIIDHMNNIQGPPLAQSAAVHS